MASQQSPEMPRKLRTPYDVDRFRLALVPVDEAFFASETKWGVGRLERLVSSATLAAYRRGWDAYRQALDDGDPDAVEAIAPKMVEALAFMDREATAAGHRPLAPDTWEAPLADGTVLVVVRTAAEASAVIRDARRVTVSPGGGTTAEVSGATPPGETLPGETRLPPDLAVTVRQQHEGRRLEVWTLAEIARLIERHGSIVDRSAGGSWQGTPAHTGRQMDEGAAADLVRQGYPLPEPLASDVHEMIDAAAYRFAVEAPATGPQDAA